MKTLQCLMLLFILSASSAINRSVYKIVLTQKGFAQFIQYDVETPPIREFTFCSWLRFFDLTSEQSVFTFIANGNNRVVRLWLDSGGQHIHISLNGRSSSSTLVDITINSWRHICLSYQSDFGAWALYIDGRLASCEAAQSLYGFVIPGGCSIIIGYGTTDKTDIPNGLEGEVFGANMILTSTIERNHTIKRDPRYRQKTFSKNKILPDNNMKYIILSDMTLQETSETMKFPTSNTTRSFIKFSTPHSIIEHDVGLDLQARQNKLNDVSNEREIFDFRVTDKNLKSYPEKINFWTLMNDVSNISRFNGKIGKKFEQSGSGTQELPTISEFETPPPPIFQNFVRTNVKMKKPIVIPFFDIKEHEKSNPTKIISNQNTYEISDLEKPPPQEKNAKVYGQWTSSQFANSVLNYIKSFNNQYKESRKTPPTIPLTKFSDTYPYASDIKTFQVPPFKMQRRNFMDMRIRKRDIKQPEINVQIIEDDLRNQILESHAQTQPKNVKINYRGQIKNFNDLRIYRDVNNQLSRELDLSSEVVQTQPFPSDSKSDFMKLPSRFNIYKSSSLMTILPFLKSGEYFIDGNNNKKFSSSNNVDTKRLSSANKWHNAKSYNNDFTPQDIKAESEGNVNIDRKVAEANKNYPSLRLKYIPHNHKIVHSMVDDDGIANGRNLAMEISNISNTNSDSVSILKYNHGFLPGYNKNNKHRNTEKTMSNFDNDISTPNKNNFNQNVKIGNALNERYVIGKNEEQNRYSFVGGDEKIPDINRYRSDNDRGGENVPPSLGPKVCKNVEFYDRSFYVQPDGSIDITQILSPVKEKNLAIEFVVQNYRKCSLKDSTFELSPLLLIDWSKTPVRLFGGSYPKKTRDLCGFF